MSDDANAPDEQKPLDKESLANLIIAKIKLYHYSGGTPTVISEAAEPLWFEILMQAPEGMLQVFGPTAEIEEYVSKELAKRSK